MNFSRSSSVKPPRIPSSLTTSVSDPSAVRVRRHLEVSKLSARSILHHDPRATARIASEVRLRGEAMLQAGDPSNNGSHDVPTQT